VSEAAGVVTGPTEAAGVVTGPTEVLGVVIIKPVTMTIGTMLAEDEWKAPEAAEDKLIHIHTTEGIMTEETIEVLTTITIKIGEIMLKTEEITE
jgi:hypothetical protein